MPKAKKLPSGSWRCQVYAGSEKILQPDGTYKDKKIRKSFTVSDPSPAGRKECERLASEWAANHTDECGLTFGQALDEYIDARSSVLSPRTVASYQSIRKNYLQPLMSKRVDSITVDDIQREVNKLAQNHSPKTVRNIYGLLTAVMHVYRPNTAFRVDLPKTVRPNIYVPSDHEIQRLMACSENTNMELPILLAAFGPMRRGEICALTSDDIDGNVVHVCKNMVMAPDGSWIVKAPKSYAGDRFIEFPDFVAEKWEGIDGRIVDLCPNTITHRFELLLKDAGLPSFRFHDLRHYAASIQHAIGIPDVYIMERGGWGNDSTLKSVYRHVMDDKQEEMNQRANNYFSALSSHESSHK